MIHGKRMIFMVLPLLFVPLVYGLSSTPDTCAQQQKSSGPTADCGPPDDEGWILCCVPILEEDDISCEYCRELSPGNWECDTTLPDEAVQPTPPPMFGFGQNLPQDLPTLQETPPRFGQNLPQAEQVPTTLTPLPPTPPLFGQNLPQAEQVPTTLTPLPPTPPPPAGPIIFPENGEVSEQPDVEEQDEPPSPEPEQPPVDEGSEDN
jgi:hypothetical protein